MTDNKDVMQQALDAFCKLASVIGRYDLPDNPNWLVTIANNQADALRAAIAQPEQQAMLRMEAEDWAELYRLREAVKAPVSTGFATWQDLAVELKRQLKVAQPEQPAPIAQAEPACSDHPDAPHGFDRNASHSAHRYVCDCEGWMPDEESANPLQSMIDTSQELGLYDDAHSNISQPKDKP